MAEMHVGSLVRSWRDARGLSQERLAARAGVSTRHLSFIETGRSAPGKDVLLALAGALEVPLRDQNQLLLAAGLAPRYSASPLDSSALAMVRRALDHLMQQQEPFAAVVFDRLWNVVRLNQGAQRLFAAFAPPSMPPEVAGNGMLALTHPDGWKPYLVGWNDLAGHLIERLHRDVAASPRDTELAALLARVLAQPGVPAEWHHARITHAVSPFAPVHLRKGDLEVRMFTMITTIGTPLDVTAEELRIETYYPADDESEKILRSGL